MITSFEVGAVFKIINEASPTLARILKQVRELNLAIDKARENLALIGRLSVNPTGITTAVAETESLAKAWGNVAKSAGDARKAIGSATSSARLAAPATAAAGAGGGGRNRLGSYLAGGGAHITGPGVAIPGGSHVRAGGSVAMAGAGLLGYGVYQAAEIDRTVWQLIYHAALEHNDANRAKFRKMIQDAQTTSGYGVKDIGEAAKQEIRMFQGTPGGGVEVLPEMLRAATIESLLKDGSTPHESMRALIGLAHMTKQYSPEAIKKLAPAFAFLSTANPSSLSSMERAAGYAVPLLQSGLEVDPMDTLLLGTALTRAGATNTKSGTWLREMALRAMPGTSLMSKMAFKKHEEALKAFGLVDDKGKPTWFTDDKPDLMKMLDIAGGKAASIPVEKRAAYERALFGAQGGGGFALLADPAVREQVQSLRGTMQSDEFKNRYGGFMQAYNNDVTAQGARVAMQEFNVTMADIGQAVLPSVNRALHDFKDGLEAIRGVLPGSKTGTVGARVLEGMAGGAVAGAAIGAFGGPVGMVGGAILGGAGAGVLGIAEQYMKNAAEKKPNAEELRQQISTAEAVLSAAAGAPITLNINMDGDRLATAVSKRINSMSTFTTQAPAHDGAGLAVGGDHNATGGN